MRLLLLMLTLTVVLPIAAFCQTRERQVGSMDLAGASFRIAVTKSGNEAASILIHLKERPGVLSLSCNTSPELLQKFIVAVDSLVANTTKPMKGETVTLQPAGLPCAPSAVVAVARRIGGEVEWIIVGMPTPATYRVVAGLPSKYMPQFLQLVRDAASAAEQMQAP